MTAPTEPGTPIEGLTFDAALVALEETVAGLEAGGQQLEDTIALYERAVALGGLDVVALKDEPESRA